MEHGNRNDIRAEDSDRRRIGGGDGTERERKRRGDGNIRCIECVREDSTDIKFVAVSAINGQRRLEAFRHDAQIVRTEEMIDVGMRNGDGVNDRDLFPQ